jgi:hypothetical protein
MVPVRDQGRWSRALEGIPHGFFHTWAACRAFARGAEERTFLYVAQVGEIRVVCPLVERQWEGTVDVVTPYGFSGFVGTAPYSGFPGAWRDFARSRGWVCGFVGLNPVLGGEDYGEAGEARRYNRLFVLDLCSGERELLAQMSPGPVMDQRALAEFFLEHYEEFFARRGAGSVYRFDPAVLRAVFDLPEVFLVGAAGPRGIEAVSAFGWTSWAGEFLFNVSVPEGRRWSAALIWCGARRLMDLGVPVLNLGGGIRDGDGVAAFKRRFGARELPLSALCQVYDRPAYEKLCRRAGVDPWAAGYFPPYRGAQDSGASAVVAPSEVRHLAEEVR